MTITVVVGPPCSGKSTFVDEHAKDGDVVVDFDRLAAAFGSKTAHDAPYAIRNVTHAAREAAIDLILAGIEADAWIIHSSPTPEWMSRYETAGAQVQELDPGIDACLTRAREDSRPEWTEDAINRWYASEKRAGGLMLTKNHAIELVEFKAGPDDGLEEGQFTAYASVFGNKDSYGDVVLPGAFANTLAEWVKSGNPIPLLFGHNMSDPDYNIGHVVKAEEDNVGLKIVGQLDLDNPKAKQVYRMLKGRRINQMSFAYDEINAGPATHDGQDVWELRELKLYEVSVVAIGANQETEILAVKAIPAVAERALRDVKAGRVLSAKNESELRGAHEAIGRVLSVLDSTSDEEKASESGPSKPAPQEVSVEANRKSSVTTSALELIELELASAI
jgi:HK97 family phage prohead protease